MKKLSFLFALAGMVLFTSCGDDDPVVIPEPTISAQSFIASIMENPELGQSIGTVSATTSSGNINYELSMVSPEGAIAINSSTGEITVADVAAFDFEVNAEVTARNAFVNIKVLLTYFEQKLHKLPFLQKVASLMKRLLTS